MTNGRGSVFFYALAAIAFGVALQGSNGSVQAGSMGRSMAWLTLAVALTACGAAGSTPAFLKAAGERGLRVVLVFGLLLQFVELLTKRPAQSLPPGDRAWLLPFAAGIGLASVVVVLALRDWRRFGRWMIPSLAVIFIALGIWTIRHTPDPPIDVHAFQQEALRVLSHGSNPYAITQPRYFGDPGWYGRALGEDGRVSVGLAYPPLGLLLQLPSFVLFGDFRYSSVLALALAAFMLARCRQDATGALAAAVLLFTPRTFFLIEQGWTEPFVVLGLCAAVHASLRSPRWLPLALGFLFAAKQYAVFLAPLAFVLLPVGGERRPGRVLWRGIAVAAAITLPFAVWDPGAFVYSTVTYLFRLPFRPDSLSYLSLYARVTGAQLPSWVGFAAMLGVLPFVLRRNERSASGFAAAGAVVLLTFFLFSKQAFCNYYFVVIAALCCTVAAALPPLPARSAFR